MNMKRKKPFAFILDWGLFPDQTLVVVGTKSLEEIKALAKKIKASKAFIDDLNSLVEYTDKPFFGRCKGNGSSVLQLPPYEDTWVFWETLMHELHHAVYLTLDIGRDMRGEVEALAYAHESLFRIVRRGLQKVDKLKTVTI